VMLHGQLTLNQIELHGSDAIHLGEPPANQLFFGRAVHFLDEENHFGGTVYNCCHGLLHGVGHCVMAVLMFAMILVFVIVMVVMTAIGHAGS